MKEIVIGSRGSPLALQQAKLVQQAIQKYNPDVIARIEIIHTSGDKMSRVALSQFTTSVKGLFVKEIEEALRGQHIDLAVHSLKDLPGQLPEGLCLGAIPEREDPRDVLVATTKISSLKELPEGAHLGTSSLRRRVQLQYLRPDLSICPIRGNVNTRLKKIRQRNLDGIVLAAAGLKRLGLEEKITYVFPVEEMVPAMGQGALAVEIRSDDTAARQIIEPLDHLPTKRCALAERKFLQKMGGGCHLPMGAHAYIRNGKAVFSALVGSPSQPQMVRRVSEGSVQDLQKLALEAADYLLSHGADEILRELNAQYQT
ncbi:hydroxymethylbilane synthase [Acidobacteria bacterium AH-259-A15]|nr:hydroxymethylbilane synthase [Acidobacteria bacterium AH-259-A15]